MTSASILALTLALSGCTLVLTGEELLGAPDAGARRDAGRDSGRSARDGGVDARSPPGPDAGPGMCAGGPLSAPLSGCAPVPFPETGDPYADCVARINQLRWDCECLPPLERWREGEGCADSHAEYDSTRSASQGWREGICAEGGHAQNECPDHGSVGEIIGVCLQRMWDEGPGEPFSAHGHYITMSSDYTRVACGFHTTPGGRIWSVQNFE